MKPTVWMPCMVKDLLADTLHLDNSQFGSYWLLICAYWMRRGPLVDDDTQLRQISRCKESEWARTKVVLAEFFDTSNGLWAHEKVDKLLAEAIENMRVQQARTEAARKAAAANKPPKKPVTDPVTGRVTESSSPSPTPPSDVCVYPDSKPPDIPVELPPGFPVTVGDAIRACMTCGLSVDFITKTWDKAMGRGGRDSKDVPIRIWPNYAKSEWKYEQDHNARNSHKNNNSTHANSTPRGKQPDYSKGF
jgi:uncharacterized protein YdaU (DUF1376 family)